MNMSFKAQVCVCHSVVVSYEFFEKDSGFYQCSVGSMAVFISPMQNSHPSQLWHNYDGFVGSQLRLKLCEALSTPSNHCTPFASGQSTKITASPRAGPRITKEISLSQVGKSTLPDHSSLLSELEEHRENSNQAADQFIESAPLKFEFKTSNGLTKST